MTTISEGVLLIGKGLVVRSYLVRFLFHAMEQRLHDVPWPSTELFAGEDLAMGVEPIADAIIQRNAQASAPCEHSPV